MDLSSFWRSSNIRKLEKTKSFQHLEKILHEEKWYKPFLDYSEKASNVNRVYIAISCGFILFTFLFYHFGIQLICSGVGFFYPAYQTIESLEEFDVQKGKRWLTYWLVFATFNFLEMFLFFLRWLPGYWILKCLFYMWCYAPVPTNGSHVIYCFIIRTHFQKNRKVIDEAINTVMMKAQAKLASRR